MASSYPHKKVVATTIVCVIAVVSVIYYVYGSNQPEKSAGISAHSADNIAAAGSAEDWQQQFFQGTTTSLKKGSSSGSAAPAEESRTLTEQFGRNFFARFMLLKQTNSTSDPAAVQNVVNETMDDLMFVAPEATSYKMEDILIGAGVGAAAERAYANTVGAIFSTHAPRTDAATVASQALEQGDTNMLKEIAGITNGYSTMLKKILLVPVPESLASRHLNLVNGISGMQFVSAGMAKVAADPLEGLVSLAVYEKSMNSFRDSLLDLQYYFSSQGMNFTNKEPAIVFTMIK